MKIFIIMIRTNCDFNYADISSILHLQLIQNK